MKHLLIMVLAIGTFGTLDAFACNSSKEICKNATVFVIHENEADGFWAAYTSINRGKILSLNRNEALVRVEEYNRSVTKYYPLNKIARSSGCNNYGFCVGNRVVNTDSDESVVVGIFNNSNQMVIQDRIGSRNYEITKPWDGRGSGVTKL